MSRDEALQRAKEGLPIESAREVVFALRFIQERVTPHTKAWFMLNRAQLEAMKLADEEEANP